LQIGIHLVKGKKGKGRTFVQRLFMNLIAEALRYGPQLLPCKVAIPALPRKHSPDGGTMASGSNHMIAAYYSFIDPERTKG